MKLWKLYILLILLFFNSCREVQTISIEKFGVFEVALEAVKRYDNPYVELNTEAEIVRPDGSIWSIPLFWDGGQTWKLRVSPDLEGKWSYKINSDDKGLNKKSGSFTCILSERRGSIQFMNGFLHHFQYQHGEKMWFMGETAWALFTDNAEEKHDRNAVGKFLETRASQGFNVVHAMMLSEAGWGNSGGLPFDNMEKQIINPDYWKEVDTRIAMANQQGIVVGLAIAWGGKRKNEPFAWRMFPGLEARKRYARYMAARYSAYDVYFLVSGEWGGEIRSRPSTEEEIRKEFIEIGNALDAAEPHGRMIGIHPGSKEGNVRAYNDADWMNFGDYQQNYNDLHNSVLKSREFNKPVVNSEYGYHLRDQDGNGIPDKHNSTSLESIRKASWDIVMAGGYLVTGFGTTYFGGYRDPGPFDIDAPKNDEWEIQIGWIKKFFTSIDYWKLESHDEWLTSTTPRGKDEKRLEREEPPTTAYWLLAEPGKVYIIYARGLTEPLKLHPGQNTSGSYQIQLFNPRTGELKSLHEEYGIYDDYTWTPPDEEDWVLSMVK